MKKEHRNFKKGFFILFCGNFASQMIPLIFLPVLVKLYSISSIGIYATFISVTALLMLLSTLQLDHVIPLRTIRSAERMQGAICWLCMFFSTWLLVSLAGLNAMTSLLELYWVWGLPFAVFLNGFMQIKTAWLIKLGEYQALSISKFLDVLIFSITAICLSFFNHSDEVLILSRILGLSSAALFLYLFLRDGRRKLKIHNQLRWLYQALIHYRYFICYELPARLIYSCSGHSIILIMALCYQEEYVAFISIALRMIGIPFMLFAKSLGDLYREHAAREIRDTGICSNSYNQGFKWLVLIGIISTIFLWTCSSAAVSIVLGDEWNQVAKYVKILTPFFIIRLIAIPLERTFIVKSCAQIDFYFQLFISIASIFSILIGYMYNPLDPAVAISIFSASMTIVYMVNLFFSYKVSSNERELLCQKI